MPIVTCRNVGVSFGNDVVLANVDLSIERGERLCLAGRNGSGKSTLMRLISGEAAPDEGRIWRDEGVRFAVLDQNLPDRSDATVYEAVAGGFEGMGSVLAEYHALTSGLSESGGLARLTTLQAQIEAEDGWSLAHRIESILDRMDLAADQQLSALSGGWLKRVAIAKSLVTEPDVWLLDEPTNHLDIPTIEWLEQRLLEFPGTVIFVSHDRALMQSAATAILSIDRGKVARWDCDYHTWLRRREHEAEVEAQQNKRFDDKLKKEEAWIREGIKARRTRNEGRVRALSALREERSRRRSQKHLKMEVDAGIASGKIVKELIDVSKGYGAQQLINHFDLVIQRGDRLGLLGPNGAGKTTLLDILLEKTAPDSGTVRSGTRLQVAYYDQVRAQLDPERSVSDYISEGRQYVTVNGKDVHVVSYLANFMFDADQARAPIRTLSGGEQNRLLLARLFSLPANLLILDEPTNDLDVETLELLEELLLEYTGTVIMVSHDRSFLDNVVSSLIVFEGGGVVREYVGGYEDWHRGGGRFRESDEAMASTGPTAQQSKRRRGADIRQQSREQQKRERDIQKVEGKIELIEARIAALQEEMGIAAFYDRNEADQAATFEQLKALEEELALLYSKWEALENG